MPIADIGWAACAAAVRCDDDDDDDKPLTERELKLKQYIDGLQAQAKLSPEVEKHSAREVQAEYVLPVAQVDERRLFDERARGRVHAVRRAQRAAQPVQHRVPPRVVLRTSRHVTGGSGSRGARI